MTPYDADLFDAELALARSAVRSDADTLTTSEIGMVLGSTSVAGARQRVRRALRSGELPPCAIKGTHHNEEGEDRWWRADVTKLLVQRLRSKRHSTR